MGDDSTFQVAKTVLQDYQIWSRTPPAVREYIETNIGKTENETLPENSPLLIYNRSQYVIIANNDRAMVAAGEKAKQLGYKVQLIAFGTGTTESKIKAEVNEELENIFRIVVPHLIDTDSITFASFSTDGIDGNSKLAGAMADSDTLKLASGQGLDYKNYLANYDSATFFKKLGLGIETGPTGTNVADVTVVLVNNPDKPVRKLAFIFGGEATVNISLPGGMKPGSGGRNTHLVLLAAEKMAQLI